MSRLKDALDRAGRKNSDQPTQTFTPPTQVVREAWAFQDGDELAAQIVGDTPLHGADAVSTDGPGALVADVLAPAAQFAPEKPAAAPVATTGTVELGDSASVRRARAEFWGRYPFGAKGIGKVIVGPNTDPGLVEQYRRLGAALHHHQLHTGARTLMVTSAAASEGKTLTATNLALTMSHSYQRRVLLIDADLRRPSIHEILRLPNSVGLSDSLRHPERAVARYHTITSTLSVFSAGRPDSDPMAGLVSETMNRILTDATQTFDWVIVDTPPVALLPDANLLAAMIDTALLVIGANSTPYPLIRRAIEAIGEQRILGVVLNRMATADIVASYNYYGYGYGAYAYGVARKRRRGLMFWRKSGESPAKPAAAPPPSAGLDVAES
ncbi:MAG TPA: CpsD/CapB family tyrosine-protein kinase [Vicinamibacterales bacterium]|nr:CpsD/CapB family tyrosine-protein kinase [Vicinamibacterales bacterium]